MAETNENGSPVRRRHRRKEHGYFSELFRSIYKELREAHEERKERKKVKKQAKQEAKALRGPQKKLSVTRSLNKMLRFFHIKGEFRRAEKGSRHGFFKFLPKWKYFKTKEE